MSHAVDNHFQGLKRLFPGNLRRTCGLSASSSFPCGGRGEEELFLLAQSLRNEIRTLILWAVAERRAKEELCVLLGSLLKRYSMLRARAYRFAINNFIVRETETYCSFRLDTEELTLLWTGSG